MDTKNSIILRDYQEESIAHVTKGFANHNSGLLVLPTAAGKTVIAASLFKRYISKYPTHKCIFVVHRQELFQQALNKFRAFGINTSGWSANIKDTSGNLIVVMKDSARGIDKSLQNKVVGLYLVDEAHHDAADSYKTLRDNLKPVYRLGLTATPTRLDGRDLEFGRIFYQRTYLDLMRQGWLSRPNYIRIRTEENLDFHLSRQEISNKDLEQLNNDYRNKLIARIYCEMQETAGRTLIFAINIDHATSIKNSINELDPTVKIGVLHGKLEDGVRAQMLKDFADNKIQVLINVAIAIEGFDEPLIKTVMLCRPTASETYFMQMIGRGARLKAERYSKLNKFNIVSFIDGDTLLSRIMDCWAYEHLGADMPDDVLEEVAISLDEQKAKEHLDNYKGFLKEIGTTRPLDKARAEVYKIVGAYIFTTKKRTTRYVVDIKKKALLEDFINHCRELYTNATSIDMEACYYSFKPKHGHKMWFNKYTWFSIASSVFSMLKGYAQINDRPPVEFVPFVLKEDDDVQED